MRRTVLAGVLDVAAANLRHAAAVRLFEVGPVFLPRAGATLPDEPRRLALVLAGPRRPAFWEDAPGTTVPALDFFDLKGVVETLAADLHLPDVAFEPAQRPHLHPGRAAAWLVGGQPAGAFG